MANKNISTAARILEPARIIYVDEACVVVNKLSGEAVEGAKKQMGDLPQMLNKALVASLPAVSTVAAADKLPLPVAPHRLDVPVSGCALFARTQESLAFLNEVFASGSAEKHYWAIIEKPPQAIIDGLGSNGTLTHWLEFDAKKNKATAFNEPQPSPKGEGSPLEQAPGRKKAVLQYKLIGAGENYLFMEIIPLTGRHHQIRCQLEKVGLHIKGDLKYGARRSEKNGGIRLHARSLAFPSPMKGEKITVTAEPPQDNLWTAFAAAATTLLASNAGN